MHVIKKIYITSFLIIFLFLNSELRAQFFQSVTVSYDRIYSAFNFGRFPEKEEFYSSMWDASAGKSPNISNISVWATRNYNKKLLKGISFGVQTFQFEYQRGAPHWPNYILIRPRLNKVNVNFIFLKRQNDYFKTQIGLNLGRVLFISQSRKHAKIIRKGYFADSELYKPNISDNYDQPLPVTGEIQVDIIAPLKNRINLFLGMNVWLNDQISVGYYNQYGAITNGKLKFPWTFNLGLNYEMKKNDKK
jgi:hypothetical protein